MCECLTFAAEAVRPATQFASVDLAYDLKTLSLHPKKLHSSDFARSEIVACLVSGAA